MGATQQRTFSIYYESKHTTNVRVLLAGLALAVYHLTSISLSLLRHHLDFYSQVRRVLYDQRSVKRRRRNISGYALGDVDHFVSVGGGGLDGFLDVLDGVGSDSRTSVISECGG